MGGAETGLLGIDREVEHQASLRAAEVGLGPDVVAFFPGDSWLVTRFIDGRPIPFEEMRRPQTIRRVAAALIKLHGAAQIPGRFDAHAVVEEYRREAEAHGVEVPPAYAAAHATSEQIRRTRGAQATVPCHNDLLNANFLDDGEIRIVDWEYAGMGDRFFDLANLSVNHEFGPAEDEASEARFRLRFAGLEQGITSYEVSLVELHGEAQSGLIRIVLRADVGAPDPVPLLEPERVHRLVAARIQPVAAARVPNGVPQAQAELGWAVQLPSELADIGDSQRKAGHRTDRQLSGGHVREGWLEMSVEVR